MGLNVGCIIGVSGLKGNGNQDGVNTKGERWWMKGTKGK